MQANKNGFFYVLDRKSGELLSAKTYTYINWASGVDMKTGRPVPTPQADWYASPKNVYPSWAGATPGIRCPTAARRTWCTSRCIDVPSVWVDLAHNGGALKYLDGFFTANGIFPMTPMMRRI